MVKKLNTDNIDSALTQPKKLENDMFSSDFPKNKPKWARLRKVNVLMDWKHKNVADEISFTVMQNRDSGVERITGNSVIRAILECLSVKKDALGLESVSDEVELVSRLMKLFK